MKRILLDTHILLWWLDASPKLSKSTRALLADPENLLFLSAASLWEIRIKQSLGRLDLPSRFDQAIAGLGFEELGISIAHTSELPKLPLLHHDPFDRMLLAQAIVENLALLSADRNLIAYGKPVFPA